MLFLGFDPINNPFDNVDICYYKIFNKVILEELDLNDWLIGSTASNQIN